jgi:cytochrome P450
VSTTDWIAQRPRITSFDEAAEVLSSKEFKQSKDASHQVIGIKVQTLVSLNGDEHLQRRRAESALFARAQLRHYELEVMERAFDSRLRALDTSQPGDWARADLLELSRLSLMPTASAVIGLDLSG